MKIIHFTHTCLSQTLGTSRRLIQLLLDDGNIHYFVSPRFTTGLAINRNWEKHENFFLRKCRYFHRLGPNLPIISRYLKAVLNSRLMVKMVEENGFNLVFGHNPLDFALAGMRYARQFNLPFIYEAHMLIFDEVAGRKRYGIPLFVNRLAKRIAWHYEAALIKNASRVIVQTQQLKSRVERLYRTEPEKIVLVPNGVDTKQFQPALYRSEGENLREKRGWGQKVIILYSGFLDDINGIDFLLKAVQKIESGVRKKLKFVFSGDGPLRDKISQAAEKEPECFEYLGVIEHKRLPVLYQAADLFVIPRPPSLAAESLIPLKLLEVMAMGKPVLVSNMPAMMALVEDQKSGFIFQGGEKKDFIEKLGLVVHSLDKLENLKKEARRRVILNFNWTRSRKILNRIYQEHAE